VYSPLYDDRKLTTFSVMSFVGYDYLKQRGMPPDVDGAVQNEMFGDQSPLY
jgi:hypothetical protein